jgi:hypothetical protein
MKFFWVGLFLTLPLSACGQTGSTSTSAFPSITLVKETRPNKPELLVAWYHSFQDSCIKAWEAKGRVIPKSVMIPSQDILNASVTRVEEYFQGDNYAHYSKETRVGKFDNDSCKFLPPIQFEEIQLVRGCESISIDVTHSRIEKISDCQDPLINGLKANDSRGASFKFGPKEETVAGQVCGYVESNKLLAALGEQCYLKSIPYYAPVHRDVVLKVDLSNSALEKSMNQWMGGVISDHKGSTLVSTIATQVKIGELIPREKFYADKGRENYVPMGTDGPTATSVDDSRPSNDSGKQAPSKTMTNKEFEKMMQEQTKAMEDAAKKLKSGSEK